ncbi:helix-turn-helix transcriptional regulator [Jiangella gansuensis]|uniref:helix-turn-helix transcriptional regulator n=1 Tax=Jiangella gansuensis TaxID=281473 RepID=UPI0004ADF5F6|nr:WYL domain-containing protein [Jiangella gansuensis]
MTIDTSPTARALVALELIQGSPGVTAQRLADKLGVSERAARRYVGILREAGVPIEAARGQHGGFRVGRGVRLPPLMFTASEVLGLVMAVLDGHHDAADAAGPVGSALGKLLRSLPEPVATQAATMRRSAAPAPDRAAARPDPSTATTLVQASAERHAVRLDYRSEAGSEWTTDVDPWAVVVRHGRWYLLCWSHRAQAQRAYRIDRVTAVDVLPSSFTPPRDLDAVAALETHLARGWEYDAEVVIEGPLETVRPCVRSTLGTLEPTDENTTRLTGSTSNPHWYAEQLAALPVPFRIVHGPELRAAARAVGERLLAAADGPLTPSAPATSAAPEPSDHTTGAPDE